MTTGNNSGPAGRLRRWARAVRSAYFSSFDFASIPLDGPLPDLSATAAGGSVNLSPDSRLTYDQPFTTDALSFIHYNGLDSFMYRVRNADGSTADATVTLTVGSGVQPALTRNPIPWWARLQTS